MYQMHGGDEQQVVTTLPLAQSLGFEPRVGYQPTHDFQSCALDHSANSAYSFVCCGGSTATMIIIAPWNSNVKGKFVFFQKNI